MPWFCTLIYLTNSELYSDQDLQEGSLRLNGNKGEDSVKIKLRSVDVSPTYRVGSLIN